MVKDKIKGRISCLSQFLGIFCYPLLQKMPKWGCHPTLVNVVRTVVKYIDNPDIDYTFSFGLLFHDYFSLSSVFLFLEIGREYMENKSAFDQKALEYVRKYALPRF
jgi:hypothetical protein